MGQNEARRGKKVLRCAEGDLDTATYRTDFVTNFPRGYLGGLGMTVYSCRTMYVEMKDLIINYWYFVLQYVLRCTVVRLPCGLKSDVLHGKCVEMV